MMDTGYYTFVTALTMDHTRVKPNVNYVLWLPMIYQWRFINHNKCATVGPDDSGGGYAHVGTGWIWEIRVHATQFCCESKTALNK